MSRHTLFAFIRYITMGSFAVSFQFLLLTVCVEVGHLNPTLSSGIGFVGGAGVNYLLQYYVTFRAKGAHLSTALKYGLVMMSTLMVNLVLFWSLTDVLGLWYIYSQFVSICVVVVLNFFLNRRYTFKSA